LEGSGERILTVIGTLEQIVAAVRLVVIKIWDDPKCRYDNISTTYKSDGGGGGDERGGGGYGGGGVCVCVLHCRCSVLVPQLGKCNCCGHLVILVSSNLSVIRSFFPLDLSVHCVSFNTYAGGMGGGYGSGGAHRGGGGYDRDDRGGDRYGGAPRCEVPSSFACHWPRACIPRLSLYAPARTLCKSLKLATRLTATQRRALRDVQTCGRAHLFIHLCVLLCVRDARCLLFACAA